MKTPVTKYIFLIVIIALGSYIVIPSINYSNCKCNELFLKIGFDGVVLTKYLDKSQHSTPVIEVINLGGDVSKIDLFAERSGIFEIIKPKDTIRKIQGNNTILIKVNKEYKILGVADFSCDSTKLKSEEILFPVYHLFETTH